MSTSISRMATLAIILAFGSAFVMASASDTPQTASILASYIVGH